MAKFQEEAASIRQQLTELDQINPPQDSVDLKRIHMVMHGNYVIIDHDRKNVLRR